MANASPTINERRVKEFDLDIEQENQSTSLQKSLLSAFHGFFKHTEEVGEKEVSDESIVMQQDNIQLRPKV